MTVKACKTSKQIMVQLLQTGTDEKPSSKTVSQVLLIFYNSIGRVPQIKHTCEGRKIPFIKNVCNNFDEKEIRTNTKDRN
jgi:hypothetical protein